jgi:hypothetical protein
MQNLEFKKKFFFKDIKLEGGHLGRGRGPAEGGSG